MLTLGNGKLGDSWIWHFDLPSADPEVCRWATPTCLSLCYMKHLQKRPNVWRNYVQNLVLSRSGDFVKLLVKEARRVNAFLIRPHVSGEFYSAEYAVKWLEIMGTLPKVRFFFYSRSWQDPEIDQVFHDMAHLRNVRVWYSCDRDTGKPPSLPRRARIAYLQATPEDVPPAWAHLNFRPRKLRKKPEAKSNGVMNCPKETGLPPASEVTCQSCQHCFQNPGTTSGKRLSLQLL